jgi:hypothetical protein
MTVSSVQLARKKERIWLIILFFGSVIFKHSEMLSLSRADKIFLSGHPGRIFSVGSGQT